MTTLTAASRIPAADFGSDAADSLDNLRIDQLARPKILLYSHDTFGLGNIRRSLLLGDLLTSTYPGAAVLLVTGSPMIHAFRIPARMDYVKLPCVNRVSADTYEPRFLLECASEVRQTRSEIIERTAVGFGPDLLIVDKRAAGIDGELLPALAALRARPNRPRIVLGLRDILDAPEVSRRALRANGSFDVIEQYYDEVWVYGSPAVFDVVSEYGFPAAVARRTTYCGYLRRRPVVRAPHAGPPRVLVTTGGGGDGAVLIETFLDAVKQTAPFTMRTLVVLGPQLDPSTAVRLRATAAGRADVEYLEFEPDMTRRYEEADVVVAMAGYNTVCELLTAGVKAVLVPRGEPVQEQLIRARRLSERGHFRMVEPAELTPASLMAQVRSALVAPPAPPSTIDMEGLSRIHARVRRLLEPSAS